MHFSGFMSLVYEDWWISGPLLSGEFRALCYPGSFGLGQPLLLGTRWFYTTPAASIFWD